MGRVNADDWDDDFIHSPDRSKTKPGEKRNKIKAEVIATVYEMLFGL